MNFIIGSIFILALACYDPHLFSLLFTLFLLWCVAYTLGTWLFGGTLKYIPKPVRNFNTKPYGKWAAKQAYRYSYGIQRERRGVLFAIAHAMLIISALVTFLTYFGKIQDWTYVIHLWPITIALFLIWYVWKTNFPKTRPMPGRQRR